jgi:hypothetical protein
VQDVGRVGEEVRAEVVGELGLGQLGEVLLQLVFGVAPREVRVGLREAELGETAHHLGPREGLGQKDHVGVLVVDGVDQPLPERERLRVRVVDAEDLHAVTDPEVDHTLQLAPQPFFVGRVEVDRVDVLVLLRRVLGVLDRAVRPDREPVGVLGDPGVVG